MKRTIRDLLNKQSRVYVYLKNEEVAKGFLLVAENEGFSFCDGTPPTQRECASVMAVNNDMTINYVGFAGHMAFGCAESVGGKRLFRVDYQRYMMGE